MLSRGLIDVVSCMLYPLRPPMLLAASHHLPHVSIPLRELLIAPESLPYVATLRAEHTKSHRGENILA